MSETPNIRNFLNGHTFKMSKICKFMRVHSCVREDSIQIVPDAEGGNTKQIQMCARAAGCGGGKYNRLQTWRGRYKKTKIIQTAPDAQGAIQ
jgi:hypothetical protein